MIQILVPPLDTAGRIRHTLVNPRQSDLFISPQAAKASGRSLAARGHERCLTSAAAGSSRRSGSGAAMEGNSLRQGIFSVRRWILSELSILDRGLVDFPGAQNRETGRPEQRLFNAEQGIKAAPRRASSRVNPGAVCNAIVAIFAAFKPEHWPGR
jgi:hypothetical protein